MKSYIAKFCTWSLGMVSLCCLHSCSSAEKASSIDVEKVSAYVSPVIGTAHCRWFHFAPGAMPFGLAKPGPSTNGSLGNKSGWEATGYDYRDTSIDGFPCLHEFQVGGIVLMPTAGTLKTTPGPVDSQGVGYRSRFSHDDEVVEPGYYKVLLKDYNISAEVTATERVAYQRYTFPKGTESHILFDIGNQQGESGKAVNAAVSVTEDGLVEGWVETLPEYVRVYQDGATVKLYFSAQVDAKPSAVGTFQKAKHYAGKHQIKGVGAGAYLTFDTSKNQIVTAQVGLSYTSVANARLNRKEETHQGRLDFDEVHAQSARTWENHLGRIRVKSNSEKDKVKFYTGLYHALLGRGMANDINGAYPKHDGTVGQLPMKDGQPAFRFCNTDALWGAQWNLEQVWALAYPKFLSDIVSTHIQVYKDAGWLSDGIANSRFVSGVGTNQVSHAIAAAYACGIRDFDIKTGYEAARKDVLDGQNRPKGAGKLDLDNFLKLGYSSYNLDDAGDYHNVYSFCASHTLEYAFDSYVVGQMAKALGHQEDYKKLMYYADAWKRIYDTETHFVRPRKADGSFIEPFNPMEVWRGFQEGNAWQYTFYVPHDIDGLVSMLGTEKFNARLDSIFRQAETQLFSSGAPSVGEDIDAFSGLQTLYNHGNQPCLHESWLFCESGKPALSQKWVRAILDKFYGTDGIHGYGYGQDEDQGQLGAWYVLSSMGIFDVKGLAESDAQFAIGSPVFDEITVQLDPTYYSGQSFTIKCKGNSATMPYVQGATWNGKPVQNLHIPFKQIVSGGELELTMGTEPNGI